MRSNTDSVRYFIYARKSSEDKQKQVQSIEDQVAAMKAVAARHGVEVSEIFTEVKSGKTPHGRPIFEEMIQRIKNGEAQGILVWKLDRLGRNPVDIATIQWLLEQSTIRAILTPEKEYKPEDSSYIISVEGAGGTQYIRDLSRNVKRGLKSKLEKGWMPCSAPLGYLNTKTEARGENYIVKDPERFPLLRKAWDLMLTGTFTADQILHKLNNEWGFRTRKGKVRGEKPMSRSAIYRMFTNPFYAGMINYRVGGSSGIDTHESPLIHGKHDPMVSSDEFDRVQRLLGRKGRPRPNEFHDYAFTGMVRCGECGGFISATSKQKTLRGTGQRRSYTLYYCVRARRDKSKCSQRQYTNLNTIEDQILDEISKFTIIPEFRDWAMGVLAEQDDREFAEHNRIVESRQNALQSAERQLTNLMRMRMQEQIDDTEYERERVRLKNEIVVLQTKNSQIDMRKESWIDLTRKAFAFATDAREAFLNGTNEVKRNILSAICLNWSLVDNKLNGQKVEWLVPFTELHMLSPMQINTLEPTNELYIERQKEAFASPYPLMRGRRDLNPRSLP